MLRACAALVLIVGVVLAGDPDPEPPDPARTGEKVVQGEWSLTAIRMGDASIDIPLKITMRLDRGKMTMSSMGTEKSGTYTLNSRKKPLEMDMVTDGKKALAIYKVDKDELTIVTAKEGGARPTDFTGKTGIVLVFRRVKK